MKGLSAAVLTLLGLIYSNPAYADWQYSKWGMTVDALRRAAPVELVPLTAQETKDHKRGSISPLLKGPYDTETFGFTVYFYFDSDGGLEEVMLVLNRGSASDLELAMSERYGPTTSKRFDNIMRLLAWRDDAKNEIIRFVHIVGGPPSVEYATTRKKRGQGL